MATGVNGMAVTANELANSKFSYEKLKHGKDGNFQSFKENLHDDAKIYFGFMANLFKTNTEYIPPPVTPADYTPSGGCTPAELRKFALKAEERRMDEMHDIKRAWPKLYGFIWTRLSSESQERLKAHVDYDNISLANNPNKLWTIIVETHSTNPSGGGPQMAVFDKAATVKAYAAVTQGKLSIGDFFKLFKQWRDKLTAHGVPLPSEPDDAMDFLTRLDSARYGDMLTDMRNDATRGIAFPQTLAAAYTTAAARVAKVKPDSSSTNAPHVFILADDAPQYSDNSNKRKRDDPAGDSSSSTGRDSGGRGGGGRHGGRGGEGARGGGARGGVRGFGRGHEDRGRGDRRTGEQQPAAVGQQAPAAATQDGSAEPGATWKTCSGCLAVGHLIRDCPKNPKNFMMRHVPVGEVDSIDSDPSVRQHRPANLACSDDQGFDQFGPTLLLLDNQASRSVVYNPRLLRDIAPMDTPYVLGGIERDSTTKLSVSETGNLPGLSRLDKTIGICEGASANLLSFAAVVDAKYDLTYDRRRDLYRVVGDDGRLFLFTRKQLSSDELSCHYSCDLSAGPDTNRVLIETVAENQARYTKREIKQARRARDLQELLGYCSTQALLDMLAQGISNCTVTRDDVLRAEQIWGPSVAALKGKTNKQTPLPAKHVAAVRAVREDHVLAVDIMFIKQIPFLLGMLIPLGLCLCEHLRDRTVDCVASALSVFSSTAKKRGFVIGEIQSDGEGAVGVMKNELGEKGIALQTSGPGQHVPVAERMIQTVKKRVRVYNHALPFVMPRLILIACVMFVVGRINFQAASSSSDKTSPFEQYSGLKIDAATDLRVKFGAYVQATVPITDNSMGTRTQGCIALHPTGNTTGSVNMLCLGTNEMVVRDQFKSLPMPDEVIRHLNQQAAQQGYSRDFDVLSVEDDLEDENSPVDTSALPNMLPIDGRPDVETVSETQARTPVSRSGVDVSSVVPFDIVMMDIPDTSPPPLRTDHFVRRSARSTNGTLPTNYEELWDDGRSTILIVHSHADRAKAVIRNHWRPHPDNRREDCSPELYAFKLSVKKALQGKRSEAAIEVIIAELLQMVTMKVFHPVHYHTLTGAERKSIIRSSMFLKDKYTASGEWEKLKARLVAGGDQQDRELYDNLSSPTAATTSVFCIAAIAAHEGRIVEIIDIGGAFLNADISPAGVKVHMRLDPILAEMLVQIDPRYKDYLERSGSVTVELDKALYGCVQAAALWFEDLKGKLLANGFTQNPYDICVFNKLGADGNQITIVLHVDDLMVTSVSQQNLDEFNDYLRSVYPSIKTNRGIVLDYLGMTFDFTVTGEVSITMDSCVEDILSGCGVTTPRPSPAASTLFDVRDTVKATSEQSEWFHSYVAKVLYLAKRVRPECLTTVAFLTTRVNECDHDDLAKLRRLLGYILGTKDRGIVLRIGENMSVSAYIDAAYGVHQQSGRSHTGGVIVLGEAGPVYAKSAKQKNVTKSSTEAELVGLSDTASQAIHVRNFVIEQGYDVGPAIIYQDNLSCMALMKRGAPASERSRHINIRHFWLYEKVQDGEVIIEHLGTVDMFANILTKPVQGAQFAREREGLTNWK